MELQILEFPFILSVLGHPISILVSDFSMTFSPCPRRRF